VQQKVALRVAEGATGLDAPVTSLLAAAAPVHWPDGERFACSTARSSGPAATSDALPQSRWKIRQRPGTTPIGAHVGPPPPHVSPAGQTRRRSCVHTHPRRCDTSPRAPRQVVGRQPHLWGAPHPRTRRQMHAPKLSIPPQPSDTAPTVRPQTRRPFAPREHPGGARCWQMRVTTRRSPRRRRSRKSHRGAHVFGRTGRYRTDRSPPPQLCPDDRRATDGSPAAVEGSAPAAPTAAHAFGEQGRPLHCAGGVEAAGGIETAGMHRSAAPRDRSRGAGRDLSREIVMKETTFSQLEAKTTVAAALKSVRGERNSPCVRNTLAILARSRDAPSLHLRADADEPSR